jgi:hypothetical protein
MLSLLGQRDHARREPQLPKCSLDCRDCSTRPFFFNLGDYIEALPLPQLVFSGLATAWANLTGER